MHCCVFVFTEAEPDQDVIERVLEPSYKHEWDWFQIGGRWTGLLDEYSPAQDEANLEPCEFCEATGTTTEAVGNKYRAYKQHVGKPCFQCEGTGKRLVWPTSYKPHSGDTQRVSDVAGLGTGNKRPYAFVLEDGTWIPNEHYIPRAKGMGRFEKDPTYQEALDEAISNYAAGWVTVVDCHN